MTLKRLNRLYALRALRLYNGDFRRTARALGIGRATLYRWLKQPSSGERNLTKAQQQAGRKLAEAQAYYLAAYGWELENGRWFHPKIPAFRYKAADAVNLTLADPLLRIG